MLNQREFLDNAKAHLSHVHEKLSWGRFAELAEIELNVLEAYRMPENSPDHLTMPKSVQRQIEWLLEQVEPKEQAGGPNQVSSEADAERNDAKRSALFQLVAPALAAMVVRIAGQLHNEGMGVVVSGIDRRPGSRVGLSAEDRRTMALVSRARLSLGLCDTTSEVHNLLSMCSRPLAEWLPLPEILKQGLGPVRLIDPVELMPTIEAEGLAEDVTGLASLMEEQLFGDFREALAKLTPSQADEAYTAVREFVVRNPVVHMKKLEGFLEELPSGVANRVRMGFYEPLEGRLDGNKGLALCSRCGNLTKSHIGGGWLCTTSACLQHGSAPMKAAPVEGEHFRLNRGLRQYWLEPGIDEVLLFDALKEKGLAPRLYPHRDRVDIDLGTEPGGVAIGLDLKAYASPELLGRRLKKRVGGLAFYAQRWLVVPDWLAEGTPGYMERLNGALGAGSIQAMTASEALQRALVLRKAKLTHSILAGPENTGA